MKEKQAACDERRMEAALPATGLYRGLSGTGDVCVGRDGKVKANEKLDQSFPIEIELGLG